MCDSSPVLVSTPPISWRKQIFRISSSLSGSSSISELQKECQKVVARFVTTLAEFVG